MKHWNTDVISRKTQQQNALRGTQQAVTQNKHLMLMIRFTGNSTGRPSKQRRVKQCKDRLQIPVYDIQVYNSLCFLRLFLQSFLSLLGEAVSDISKKHCQLFEMCKGNLWYPSTTRKNMYLKYMETKLSSYVWKFTQALTSPPLLIPLIYTQK